jgi:hypothetical protein
MLKYSSEAMKWEVGSFQLDSWNHLVCGTVWTLIGSRIQSQGKGKGNGIKRSKHMDYLKAIAGIIRRFESHHSHTDVLLKQDNKKDPYG